MQWTFLTQLLQILLSSLETASVLIYGSVCENLASNSGYMADECFVSWRSQSNECNNGFWKQRFYCVHALDIWKNQQSYGYVISGLLRDLDETRTRLRYYTAHRGNSLPTFRDNLSTSSSRVKKSYAAYYRMRAQISKLWIFYVILLGSYINCKDCVVATERDRELNTTETQVAVAYLNVLSRI